MNLRNVCRIGLLPFVLGAVACSDMDPGADTFRTVYPNLASPGGSGGDDQSGGGSSGSGGTGGSQAEPPAMLPAQWACLQGDPPTVSPAMPPPQNVNYLVPIVDFDNAPQTVADVSVKLCTSAACDPFVQIPIVQPDPARPVFLLVLPYGLMNPYLKFEAPGYATMDYYFGGPLVGVPNPDPDNDPSTPTPPFLGNVVPLLKQETLDNLLRDVQAPVPQPAGRGVLAVRTLNCTGARAPDVIVEPVSDMPDDTVRWTLSDSNAAVRGVFPTDIRGVAGFANVPEGTFRVRGIAPTGEEGEGLPYGDHTLRVRPGVITLGEVRQGIGAFGQ